MAEDGMLLNFSVPETIRNTNNVARFKGGSWKERMRLKKSAKTRAQGGGGGGEKRQFGPDQAYLRATRGPGQEAQDEEFEDPRPAKRRREDGDFTPSTASKSPRTGDNRGKKPLKQREVISSLFSYNPKPQEKEEGNVRKDESQAPTKPSNAPLPDGIDTFTSLGLSPTIAAHLLTKMDLKNPTAIQKAAIPQLIKEDTDAFIQSQTGSGKTLAYLLPIVQRIMSISGDSPGMQSPSDSHSLHRDSGLFAIVLAPTHELCKQISVVLERLLRCAHYIVAGTVMGGENKKSEKARLRKGLNILVATPGRLVDHLENTETLNVSNVRYLVLDEGDRLMDMGFEEDITKIVRTLDSKKRKGTLPGLPDQRMTMLCSATLQRNVQKLGDISLKDAILVKAEGQDDNDHLIDRDGGEDGIESAFLAPAQLKQSYIVAAAKLRLVTLTALLRRSFARKGSVMKAIVFVSCADSVEFLFSVFTRSGEVQTDQDDDVTKAKPPTRDAATAPSPTSGNRSYAVPESLADAIAPAPLLTSTPSSTTQPIASTELQVHKIHGSLAQPVRTAIMKSFSTTTTPSLLISTDVSARGLDLPNLDLVIEYDPAFSTEDHLHRIGRTARLGRDGRAVIFLLPGKEEGYVDVLRRSYKQTNEASGSVTMAPTTEVLKKGFLPTSGIVSAGKQDWEARATEFQLDVERWVLSHPSHKELAKKAFQSHIRAYATHIADERKWFDIKELHLGHLAKGFGLRDAPGQVNVRGVGKNVSTKRRNGRGDSRGAKDEARKDVRIDDVGDADAAAEKMRALVRNRKKMMGAGADEFNIG